MARRIALLATAVALLQPHPAAAIDNGIGLTPPMGWRHWKAFAAHISQDIMEEMMDEMVTKYPVDGVPTSLKDLGYLYVGLDDHWQNCTTICPNGTVVPSWAPRMHGDNLDYDYQGCVNATGGNVEGARAIPWYSDGTDPAMGPYGTPQVDTHRFPDMKGMVTKAHAMGLRAGWYMGNYQCSGANSQCNHGGKRGNVSLGANCSEWDMDRLAAGSVKALVEYGFDSVKLDSGFSVGRNLSLWVRSRTPFWNHFDPKRSFCQDRLGTNTGRVDFKRRFLQADLFNASGRPVMMENCHQGASAPGLVADGGNDGNCTGLTTPTSDCPFNFWRTTGDPGPDWGTIMRELNSLRKVVNPLYGSGKRPNSVDYNAGTYENILLAPFFVPKPHQFPKTGSGQTQGTA